MFTKVKGNNDAAPRASFIVAEECFYEDAFLNLFMLNVFSELKRNRLLTRSV